MKRLIIFERYTRDYFLIECPFDVTVVPSLGNSLTSEAPNSKSVLAYFYGRPLRRASFSFLFTFGPSSSTHTHTRPSLPLFGIIINDRWHEESAATQARSIRRPQKIITNPKTAIINLRFRHQRKGRRNLDDKRNRENREGSMASTRPNEGVSENKRCPEWAKKWRATKCKTEGN